MTLYKKIHAQQAFYRKKVEERRLKDPLFKLKLADNIIDYIHSDDSLYSQLKRLNDICDEFDFTKQNHREDREYILKMAYFGCVACAIDKNKNVLNSLTDYVNGIKKNFEIVKTDPNEPFDSHAVANKTYFSSFK